MPSSAPRPRLGVIGTGWWATQWHIPSLLEYDGADLVAVADPDGDRLQRVTTHFGIPHGFADADDLLDSGLVDGVVVATPHATHHRLAKAALGAGVHVLVEKPMTLRAAEAWDLVDLARARGLHLMVGYSAQFSRAALRLRELLATGALGNVHAVAGLFSSAVAHLYRGAVGEPGSARLIPPGGATYADPSLAGGGQGQTQTTHAAGMVVWATGSRVEEVFAYMGQADLQPGLDLVDAITYRFADGAVGTLAASGSLREGQPAQQEFRYYGSDGVALHDMGRGTLTVHTAAGVEEITPGRNDEAHPTTAPARCLADLIAGGEDNPAPGEAGARAVELIEGAYRSAATGQPVRTEDLR